MAFELPVDKLITTLIKENFPDFDVREGTAYRDMLIKPSALIVQPQRDQINVIKRNLSLANFPFMQDDEFDAMLKNIFVDRRQGSFAEGFVRLFFSDPVDTVFPDSTIFSTEDGIEFNPKTETVFTAEEISLNTEGFQFFVDVNVISTDVGADRNVAENNIAFMVNGPTSVIRIDNPQAMTGGTDLERRSEAFFRAKKSIAVRDLVTRRSIDTVILDKFPAVRAVSSVGFGDPGMDRDTAIVCADYLELIGVKTTGESTVGSDVFVDTSIDFVVSRVTPGAVLRISSGPDEGDYTIVSVLPNSLVLSSALITAATNVEYKILGIFALENFHIGGKVDVSISSSTVGVREIVLSPIPQNFELSNEPQSFYEGNNAFTLPFLGVSRAFEIDPVTREQIGTDLVEGVDFRIVTIDPVLRLSAVERVLFDLIEDDPLAARYFIGSTIQIEYFTDATVEEVNEFVQSDFDRVVTANYIVKSGRPTFVDITLQYRGETSEEEVLDVVRRFVEQFQFSSNLEASDLASTLYFFGVTFLDIDTLAMTATTTAADDTIETITSNNIITNLSDEMFVSRNITVTRIN